MPMRPSNNTAHQGWLRSRLVADTRLNTPSINAYAPNSHTSARIVGSGMRNATTPKAMARPPLRATAHQFLVKISNAIGRSSWIIVFPSCYYTGMMTGKLCARRRGHVGIAEIAPASRLNPSSGGGLVVHPLRNDRAAPIRMALILGQEKSHL